MMQKIIKYLSVFFLWLAWLVMTAHLIIPHDHHLADSFAHQGNSCPDSNSNTNHLPAFPVHCHAFNDLTSEKVFTYSFSHNIQSNSFFFSSICDPFAFNQQFHYITISDFRKPFPDTNLLGYSSLRAPPELS
jgi:hypothetical protein